MMYLIDGQTTVTSLCPVLGETYAQIHNGSCQVKLQMPHGKELKISFIGTKPYINYNPIGGSEFLVVNILAEKFKFRPKFIPEKAFDIVKQNSTVFGMLHRVRF